VLKQEWRDPQRLSHSHYVPLLPPPNLHLAAGRASRATQTMTSCWPNVSKHYSKKPNKVTQQQHRAATLQLQFHTSWYDAPLLFRAP
jgi:hypothetical protein